MAGQKKDLRTRCYEFVEAQACGEWDDKTTTEDADKLMDFVAAECRVANDTLVKALEEIAYPIRAMQARLQPDEKLDGVAANAIANNAEYLRSIALKALSIASHVLVPESDAQSLETREVQS
jgi:hypothetical protein